MLDEKIRMAIALKRFSLISPIINGQTGGITEYCIQITREPIKMPHYGLKSYAPNTIKNWYSVYMKAGIDGLKPLPRNDTGVSRVISAEMAEAILVKIDEFPKAPATKIYDLLIEEQAFLKKDASLPTVRRFINANRKQRVEEVSSDAQVCKRKSERTLANGHNVRSLRRRKEEDHYISHGLHR